MTKPKELCDLTNEDLFDFSDIPESSYEKPPDKKYEVVPDCTVPLSKDKYDRYSAYARFAEIAKVRGLILVAAPIECARYYSFKVIHAKR